MLLRGMAHTYGIVCYYGVYCIYKTCCVTTGYIVYIRHSVLLRGMAHT